MCKCVSIVFVYIPRRLPYLKRHELWNCQPNDDFAHLKHKKNLQGNDAYDYDGCAPDYIDNCNNSTQCDTHARTHTLTYQRVIKNHAMKNVHIYQHSVIGRHKYQCDNDVKSSVLRWCYYLTDFIDISPTELMSLVEQKSSYQIEEVDRDEERKNIWPIRLVEIKWWWVSSLKIQKKTAIDFFLWNVVIVINI